MLSDREAVVAASTADASAAARRRRRRSPPPPSLLAAALLRHRFTARLPSSPHHCRTTLPDHYCCCHASLPIVPLISFISEPHQTISSLRRAGGGLGHSVGASSIPLIGNRVSDWDTIGVAVFVGHASGDPDGHTSNTTCGSTTRRLAVHASVAIARRD